MVRSIITNPESNEFDADTDDEKALICTARSVTIRRMTPTQVSIPRRPVRHGQSDEEEASICTAHEITVQPATPTVVSVRVRRSVNGQPSPGAASLNAQSGNVRGSPSRPTTDPPPPSPRRARRYGVPVDAATIEQPAAQLNRTFPVARAPQRRLREERSWSVEVVAAMEEGLEKLRDEEEKDEDEGLNEKKGNGEEVEKGMEKWEL